MTRYIQAMPLTQLVEAVRRAKERAERFRNDLQKSEALTRYALIDPILRALGWDTEDPSQVRPEFSTDSGTPDYALLWDGKPHIMVEAKALGKRLEGAQDKAFQYAWQNGVPYYVATDGLRWEVYDVYERDPKKRALLQADVGDSEPGTVARLLLALWRPAMPALEVPPPSLFHPKPSRPPFPPPGTLSLKEIEQMIKAGQIQRKSPSLHSPQKAPQKVILPDGSEKPTRTWRDLLLAVADWSQPWLGTKIPLTWPKTGQSVVARDPSGMRAPKAVGPYWVETHASALYIVKSAGLILEQIGKDPSTVRVVLQ